MELIEPISTIRLTPDGGVICRFKMLTYSRVCCAFSSTDALPSNPIHIFEIGSSKAAEGAIKNPIPLSHERGRETGSRW